MIEIITKNNEILGFNYIIYPLASDNYKYGIACFDYVNKYNTYFRLEDVKSVKKTVKDLTIYEMQKLNIYMNANNEIFQFDKAKNISTKLEMTDFIDIKQCIKDYFKRIEMILTQTQDDYYID